MSVKVRIWVALILVALISGILFWFLFIRLTPDDQLIQAQTTAQMANALRAGADPDVCIERADGTMRPFIFKMLSRDEAYLRLLLDAGADPNAIEPVRGNTVLHELILWEVFVPITVDPSPRVLRKVRLLLTRGADPEKTNKDGKNVYDLLRDPLPAGRKGPSPVKVDIWRQVQEILAQYRSDKERAIKINTFE